MLNFSSKSQSDLVALSEFSDTCIGAKPGSTVGSQWGKSLSQNFAAWDLYEAVFEAGPFMFVDSR